MDRDTLIARAKLRLGDTATRITDEGYEEATKEAEAELGWTLPLSDATTTPYPEKRNWMIKRTVRHALHILKMAYAPGFKHKQENLQHRFYHLERTCQDMDKDFKEAQEESPTLFAGVDTKKMFGTTIKAGFVYDVVGNDITYSGS